ncbi:MAG: hypothetical protein E7007_02180 [Alphaproteobacteria bacterium]|nr:hypothetical protein [Alphaproteobacteria bacterium]
MKKFLLFFVGTIFMAQNVAMAVTIKKAAPVATKAASTTDNTASLVGSVLGLVSGVKQLTQQQKALTAECIPSSSEITFVNNTIKEWAKTGAKTADEVQTSLGMKRCTTPTGGYESTTRIAQGTDEKDLICYDWFGGSGNDGMVWEKFPMAVSTYYCTDGSLTGCSDKNKQYVSNIYDVFNLIDFDTADYTQQEAKMAGTLISKIENCSYAKLNAKKKALWGEFLVDTVGGLGQKTNTATIMQTVGGVANSGGMGALQSLGSIATQFMQ